MAEFPPRQVDEAMDYLLGLLAPADRRQFEARLETDTALREYVRELEQGVVALAAAVPQREAPPEMWPRIGSEIARQIRRETWLPFLRPRRLPGGWAVAGIALVVITVQGFWFRAAVQSRPERAPAAGVAAVAIPRPAPVQIAESTPPVPAPRNNFAADESARIAVLQGKISKLEEQLARQSAATQTVPDTVAPAVALARGVQLLPPAGGLQRGTKYISPELQQALLLAVAREMGWTLNTPASDSAFGTNQPAVDFADLNSPAGGSAGTTPVQVASGSPASPADFQTSPSGLPSAGLPFENSSASTTLPVAGASTTALANPVAGATANNGGLAPVLSLGNRILAAINPAILPAGSGPVTVWQMDNNGNGQIVGTVTMGSNPTVITFTGDSGQNYLLTAGGTNILAQFPPGN
jgi:hypothetical protein